MKAQTTYFEIVKAEYSSGYKIHLTFNEGRSRILDFGPFLKRAQNPMFTKYRLMKNFKSFHIEHGDLMWGDFEMIFPIVDLYRGSILKGEEDASAPLILREEFPLSKTSAKKKARGLVSYKNAKKPMREKK